MKGRSYSLKLFPPDRRVCNISIGCDIGRRSNILSISYALLGPPGEIVIPAPADIPSRKNGLWKETCFEFFLSAKGSDNYWEFNFSPAGHWNVYRFKSYRKGMEEEPAFQSLQFCVRFDPGIIRLSVDLDLEKILPVEQALKAGVCAVIKGVDGKITYWALDHPGPQPDFHRRESFIAEV